MREEYQRDHASDPLIPYEPPDASPEVRASVMQFLRSGEYAAIVAEFTGWASGEFTADDPDVQ
jgi:hypothetical protein